MHLLRMKIGEMAKEASEEGRKQEGAAFRRALFATTQKWFSAEPMEDDVSLLIRSGSRKTFYHTDWSSCQCECGTKGRKRDGESINMCWHIALVRAWIAAYAIAEMQIAINYEE